MSKKTANPKRKKAAKAKRKAVVKPKLNAFSSWFLRTRKALEQSQEEAAAAIEVSGPTVCRWERGGNPEPSALKRVCKWGKVTPKRMLDLLAAG